MSNLSVDYLCFLINIKGSLNYQIHPLCLAAGFLKEAKFDTVVYCTNYKRSWRVTVMKRFLFAGIFILLFSFPGWTQTMYVSDILTITLRSGPGIDHKILRMLKSGLKVEVIEPGEEWVKIRLSNEAEGWVLTRFLTPEQTSRLVLDKLGRKHEELLTQFSLLQNENTALKNANKHLTSELEGKEKSLKGTNEAYRTLKKDSANFLKLQADNKKITSDLSEQTKIIEKLEKENWESYIKAGLCGAGVLVVGIIIGFSSKKGQRRRSSLL